MWLRRILRILLLLVILLIAGISTLRLVTKPRYGRIPALSGKFTLNHLTIDNKERSYYLYVPPKTKKPVSLIIALQPAIGDAIQMRKITGYTLDSIADIEQLVIAYPVAYKGYWNDRLTKVKSDAANENIDDVLFIKEMRKDVAQRFHTVISNTYLLGFSQGSEMAYRICLEIPGEITAAAVVAASLSVNKEIDTAKKYLPVSILIINGMKDPFCPYEGGDVNFHGFFSRGKIYSSEATAAFWAKAAGYIINDRKKTILYNANHRIANITTYAIENHKPVILYSILNGGHTFPHPFTSGPVLFGNTNHDINAAVIAWNFFKANK